MAAVSTVDPRLLAGFMFRRSTWAGIISTGPGQARDAEIRRHEDELAGGLWVAYTGFGKHFR
jgi:hypothetical protein